MSPVCLARLSPSLTTRTTYLVPRRRPLEVITCTSDWCPYNSWISLRSRRATDPVSSSASMITRPPTMCSPPANRNMEATSDLRGPILVISNLLSSSFTAAVIATADRTPAPRPGRTAPRRCPSDLLPLHPQSLAHGRRQRIRSMPATVAVGYVAQHRAGTEALGHRPQPRRRRHRLPVRDHRVDRQLWRVLAEHIPMLLRREPRRLPRLRNQVHHDYLTRIRPDQRLVQIRDHQEDQHAGETRSVTQQHKVGLPHHQPRVITSGA